MKYKNKILIGGRALVELGSKRSTDDTDFLVSDSESTEDFIIDSENNIDYCNANGNKFFNEIYQIEKGNRIASSQSLLELKSYAFVQHCLLGHWQKADDSEYDIKFLIRKYNLKGIKIASKHLKTGELEEVNKIFLSVKY